MAHIVDSSEKSIDIGLAEDTAHSKDVASKPCMDDELFVICSYRFDIDNAY